MFTRLPSEVPCDSAERDDNVADLGNEEYFCNFMIVSDLRIIIRKI
jgi:hypothetical protein